MSGLLLSALVLIGSTLDVGSIWLPGRSETVVASWYGPGFHGRVMANGERFDSACLRTVAHKELDFGTVVAFRNPQNDRVAIGVVRDRGPHNVRDYDLSEGMAQLLDFIDEGVVTLEAIVVWSP